MLLTSLDYLYKLAVFDAKIIHQKNCQPKHL